MNRDDPLSHFLTLVSKSPPLDSVFNPWVDVDPEHDIGPECPQIRRKQLHHFLHSRLGSAKTLLIAEALGYQGGHFSGVPLTTERILLGHHRDRGVSPERVLPGLRPRRTSKPALKPQGFTEPTATIIWGSILDSGVHPESFAFWNAFPWHPYDSSKGRLSNRRPRARELDHGVEILKRFLDLFGEATPVAIGRVASRTLTRMGVRHHAVRHPAQGGANEFRRQFRRLLS
jgi:hypothetical protein